MEGYNYETGMFYDTPSAEAAVTRLNEMGYSKDDISVMMDDKAKAQHFADSTGTQATKGAVTGASVGGGLGAIVAGLTATGSIAAIAGTGGLAAPLVAGPLAAALAGLGAGGLAGGIVGALVGSGIPKEKAEEYEQGLKRGGILLGVKPRPDTQDRLRDVFSGSSARGTGTSAVDDTQTDVTSRRDASFQTDTSDTTGRLP
ncbi:MAG: hypothetical protein DLM53_05280 [Candidatus Eremiobacter antarcticus]|nr:general stress protein [Candidatus Eremiobacteraeota bacterium]MBC5807054.1 general stress protein [Candidatus Eremiobacteraeota bacterium]PZR62818.1 MAG: hypothetical protein DLM53_05280 [Candidatus Eremiobacter sp. RRmetagenome_bin22]